MSGSEHQPPVLSPLEVLKREGNSAVVPLSWENGVLSLLDQRLLPREETWICYESAGDVASAIRKMVVRGAPAIGITAAFGMVMAARALVGLEREEFISKWSEDAEFMKEARPTAVNLAWAVDRLAGLLSEHVDGSVSDLADLLEQEACAIWHEDVKACLRMGAYGQELLPASGGVLTHCNAGALATGGYGTALGVIRAARQKGKEIEVFADETRPWLQGARLTAWELVKDNIPVTLIADSAAGYLMNSGEIRAVVVGADRIAANGDVANKIGTYSVAVLARANDVPFYVAAPISTLDPRTPSGEGIPVEERGPEEVTKLAGHQVAAAGVHVRNPAFDITPHDLVSAVITERGVLRPPYGPAIHACFA